jgi:FSR family fosmidomycin resistance protein-like MFS transporter
VIIVNLQSVSLNLAFYGIAHALVDAVCAAVLTSLAFFGELEPGRVVLLYLSYNFLAFAMQVPLGCCVDRARKPGKAAQAGLLLQVVALVVFVSSPEGGILLAGLGNAFFHLGGGVVALTLTPGRATAPGIFVAPGAVGLFLGIRLGMAAPLSPVLRAALAGAAVAAFLAVGVLPLPEGYVQRRTPLPNSAPFPWALFCGVGLIFFSIMTRSYVGLSLTFPWKNANFFYAFALALAAGGGKALGGFLSDRLGFLRVSVGALSLSIFLIYWGGALGSGDSWSAVQVLLGLVGCLCFQMTMAVTLLACVKGYPGREAWAFGLNCLALFMGSLPLLLPLPWMVEFFRFLDDPIARGLLTFVSIVCLWFGLRALGVENYKNSIPDERIARSSS